jgi:hypothetical protein
VPTGVETWRSIDACRRLRSDDGQLLPNPGKVFPTGDVNPRTAVLRRSWIPLAVLMSLVHVALLPLLFDNDVLSILIGGVEPRTLLREAAGFASA